MPPRRATPPIPIGDPGRPMGTQGAPLYVRVVRDALAAHLEPAIARAVLERALGERGLPSDPDDVAAVRAHVGGPLAASLTARLGRDAAHEIVAAAEALLFGLRSDRMLDTPPLSLGPFVLVSGRDCTLARMLGVPRVTDVVGLLIEVESSPRVTVVVDAWSSPIALITIGALAAELPSTANLVVLGASDEEREAFAAVSSRAATFTDAFEPLGIVRRTPRESAPAPIAGSPKKKVVGARVAARARTHRV